MKSGLCEVCGKELSSEWVTHYFELLDYHKLCSEHKDAYLDVKSNVVIIWNGEKFVVQVSKDIIVVGVS